MPSARFMGRYEFEILRAGSAVESSEADRAAVLDAESMILPVAEPGSGPFRGREMRWTRTPGDEGQRMILVLVSGADD
ncbi:hypothetical protein GCM10017635_11250 [Paracoccus kondratievae]|uniref:Carbohydrate kinase FGGY C-terminal domain-containing protein n=1 Tax=Paracoccus kondratievae TaxID=135740 RepID=A0AAD3NX98_9RHOB|nr:hypothetical protein GCM10017635_11250 [Paracoccus kondratievae]